MDEQQANEIVQSGQWRDSGLSAQSIAELRDNPVGYVYDLMHLGTGMTIRQLMLGVYRAAEEISDWEHAWTRARRCATVRELMQVPTEPCPKCKSEQEVVSYYSGTGFAGGRIYMTTLACGHVNADESDDIAAAR